MLGVGREKYGHGQIWNWLYGRRILIAQNHLDGDGQLEGRVQKVVKSNFLVFILKIGTLFTKSLFTTLGYGNNETCVNLVTFLWPNTNHTVTLSLEYETNLSLFRLTKNSPMRLKNLTMFWTQSFNWKDWIWISILRNELISSLTTTFITNSTFK